MSMKRVIWWLIVGTKGGVNRARIIRALNERPSNANQLTELLGLDYKTVRHHLKVLQDNKIITAAGDRYGTVYFLSSCMEEEYEVFKDHLDKMWDKFKSGKDIDNKEIG
jgi:DNA-binding transcriptional ArsR family regulator